MTAGETTGGGGRALLFRGALAVAVSTFALIVAGGLVTSTDSGLAVPDWPLSFGTLFPPMTGGVRFEHTHRIIAGSVALAVAALAAALARLERRGWLKTLGFAAVFAVLAQAVLGGVTVLYRLPIAVSVLHACLGQVFFCLVSVIAFCLSPLWHRVRGAGESPARIRALLLVGAGAALLQLVLGAVLRHISAKIGPGSGAATSAVLFHAGWAFAVIGAAFSAAGTASNRHPTAAGFIRACFALSLLVTVQFFLGVGAFIFTIALSGEAARRTAEVLFTTAHQACGALILALWSLLSLYAFRCLAQETGRAGGGEKTPAFSSGGGGSR